MKIVLASSSPRRKQILEQIGLNFEVLTAQVDENVNMKNKKPYEVAEYLSYIKAWEVVRNITEPCIVIGADTIVVFKGKILGKPCDENCAYKMLSMLSGRRHDVYTGVTLFFAQSKKVMTKTFYEKTSVFFRDITSREIKEYIRTREPFDKAGGYGIQGRGSVFVKKIWGDYFNVMGLPVSRLYGEICKYL